MRRIQYAEWFGDCANALLGADTLEHLIDNLTSQRGNFETAPEPAKALISRRLLELSVLDDHRLWLLQAIRDRTLKVAAGVVGTSIRSSSAQIRASATVTAGRLNLREHLPALADALSDPAPDVRGCAVVAMGEINDPAYAANILACMADPHFSVRNAASEVTVSRRLRGAAKATLELLAHPDAFVRVVAAKTIQRLGDPAHAWRLVPLFADDSPEVRQAAVYAIAGLRELGIADDLLELVTNPSWTLRESAIQALGLMGVESAAKPIASRVEDSSAQVRVAALWALVSLSPEQPISVALKMLSDSDPEVRRSAVLCLSFSRRSRFSADLIPLLRDSDERVRCAVVDQIPSDPLACEFIDELGDMLTDVSPSVRAKALEGLTQLNAHASWPKILVLLFDPEASVRENAARWLGRFGDRRALPSLRAALNYQVEDRPAKVIKAAIKALESGERFVEPYPPG